MKQEHEGTPVTPMPAANRERGGDSITNLVRNLATDLSTLLGKEIELAKSEARESISEVKTALGALVTGAAMVTAGLVVLLLSAVYGLSNVVDAWLAALIVGASALLIGYLMVHSAKKKVSASSLAPERTIESTQKDKETVRRAI